MDRYLSAMASIKYVFGKKQNELEALKKYNQSIKYENSAHFYNAWTINGFMVGQQKIRGS